MSKDKSVRTEKLKNVLKEKTKSLLGPVLILLLIVIGILIIAFWKEEETPEEIVKVNTYEGNSSDIVLENEKSEDGYGSGNNTVYSDKKINWGNMVFQSTGCG